MADLFSSDLSQTHQTETSISLGGPPSSLAIRKCSLDDVPHLVQLCRDFHAYSIYSDEHFDPEATANTMAAAVEQGGAFTNGTGFTAAILSPLWFSPSVVVAAELAWWAPAGGGSQLRIALEDWAKAAGAVLIQFSALADDKFDKVHGNFTKNGYKLVEMSYVKRFNN